MRLICKDNWRVAY